MLKTFLSGAIFMAALTIASLFLRARQRTGDRLFTFFAVAFATLAIERVVLACVNPVSEVAPYTYLIRLTAFVLIIVAIVDKNRR